MAKEVKKNKTQPQASETDGVKKIKIRVIGIGGGGGNIVSGIAAKISKASFVAANTDFKSLKSCGKNVIKFQFGQDLTYGLGTGMNPELAKAAAKNEKERIKKLCQGQDLCILVACLGGGTGSGAAATFAKISAGLGNLTYGIFTLPFKFEGEKKIEIAINALKEIRSNLNAITVIPNERVFQVINKETPLKEALSAINQFLSESLGGLIETIYQPGLINIDFADLKTILEGKGRLAYLNTVEVQRKDEAIKEMAAEVLNSPLYPYTIKGAKGVLFNLVGEKNLSLFDVEKISKSIFELASPEAKIIFGVSQHGKHPNAIKTVLLATGCAMKIPLPASDKKKPKKRKKEIGKKIIDEPQAETKENVQKPKNLIAKPSSPTEFSRSENEGEDEGKLRRRQTSSSTEPRDSGAKVKKKEKLSSPTEFLRSKNEGEDEGKLRRRQTSLSTEPRDSGAKVKKKEKLSSPTEFSRSENEGEDEGKLRRRQTSSSTQASEGSEGGKRDSVSLSTQAPKKARTEKRAESSPVDNREKSEKIRKNGLQVQKEIEQAEREMLEKEKIWETPAFLRKK